MDCEKSLLTLFWGQKTKSCTLDQLAGLTRQWRMSVELNFSWESGIQFLADTKKTVKSRQPKKNKFLLLELECLILMLGLITREGKTFPMCKVQKEGKGAHEPKAQMARAYPRFISMKHALEYCYSKYGLLVHQRVTPQQYVTNTHLYTWVKRNKVE